MAMTIKTINPVYVNKTRESEPSKYLAFDSKDITQVKAFQDWMDVNHPNWVGATATKKGANLNKGGGYGNYGTSTTKADKLYGAEFDKQYSKSTSPVSAPTSTDTTTEPSKEEAVKQAKLGKVWKKGKGWIEDQGGALAVLEKSKGFIEGIKGLFGKTDTQTGTSTVDPTVEYTPDGKPKWSTTKKVLVIGGSALVLGLIVFAIVKSKSKGK